MVIYSLISFSFLIVVKFVFFFWVPLTQPVHLVVLCLNFLILLLTYQKRIRDCTIFMQNKLHEEYAKLKQMTNLLAMDCELA